MPEFIHARVLRLLLTPGLQAGASPLKMKASRFNFNGLPRCPGSLSAMAVPDMR
jgi:hypothetical protein